MNGTPAVFIDRDGTLIEERHYLARLEEIALFPWSGEALRVLRSAGFAVVIATNQAGIARGLFDEAFVRAAHARIDALLEADGAHVDGYYYCPHHPDGTVAAYAVPCECRKPSPGLLRAAARDLGLDLARSYVVGDRWHDVSVALNAGARGLLVRSGYGRDVEHDAPEGVRAAAIVDTLLDAARWIAAHARTPAPETR
jgi:D-glycero-D-manno-heptose 1,7-bisphosphate phosphatase